MDAFSGYNPTRAKASSSKTAPAPAEEQAPATQDTLAMLLWKLLVTVAISTEVAFVIKVEVAAIKIVVVCSC